MRLAAFLFGAALFGFACTTGAQGDPKRGLYISQAAGCLGCHTEAREGAEPYAGGRALATPFGVFYGPNITPHPQAGIGRWSERDFVNAMRQGLRPDGTHYYPVFPYPSYTRITEADLRDLWAYLRTLAPSARPSQPHALRFPFGWRRLLAAWKWLFFRPGEFVPDPAKSAQVNRGAYLTEALGHCGECHTPRNFLGGPRRERHLAGARLPDGKYATNLTPARLAKVGDAELKNLLRTAITADGDVLAETMEEVVRNTTSRLTAADLDAMVAYLRSLPARADEPK